MRYVQLRAFHYVCLYGGFSKAAHALYLTQPAVSDQIRKLEEEYDTLLFHRRGKQVTPTAVGEQLREITHRFFDAEQQAEEFLSERRKSMEGTLRIVADSAIHVTAVLGRFAARYPQVNVKLYSGNSSAVIAQLREYQADIGVLGEQADTGLTGFEWISLNATPLIAFVAASHELAQLKSATISTLAKYPLVLRESGSRTRAYVESLAASKGVTLRIAVEAEGREAVTEIVATGAAVGFVSQAELAKDPGLVAIEISDCTVLMEENLIALSDRVGSRLIAAFLALVREE